MKNVVQDLTSAGLDWAREKWKFGVGSKFIRQGEKNAVKYADEIIVLSKGVQKYFIEDGDKAESNSIGNQRELIRDFAAERPGLHLVEEYADDGYTGTNFERPGFKRMMEDIKSGKINCIIVKDLSRLGRNYIEMGKYLEQIFPMMGIQNIPFKCPHKLILLFLIFSTITIEKSQMHSSEFGGYTSSSRVF